MRENIPWCRAERLWYKSSCAEDKQRVAIDRQSPPTHPEDARYISWLGERNVATKAAIHTLERFSRSIREQVRQDEGTHEISRTFVDGEHGRFYLRIIMGKYCWRNSPRYADKMGQQGSKDKSSLSRRTDFSRDSVKMRLGSFKRGRRKWFSNRVTVILPAS